eukprot:comp13050_c0_seq1/m.8322 comp13050_c0_seq1/g.8322  ORF comp13050_c0_seq1/g.8322 comp13050_c0_seq1/m.8322 type:complete len:406 (-) comp13050_c0_seq1:536-1753(-)
MMPLYNPGPSYEAESYNPKKKGANFILQKTKAYLRQIIKDKDSRNLFFFLCINLTMAFVELAYGMWTNSLGLISDSFHMLFDCTALLVGLICSVVARWPKNDRFTYGYQRADVLAGFVNGVFLVFVAFFVFTESVERIMEPPEVNTDRLLLVSVLGFAVNLVGIFVFQHGGQMAHGHSHDGGHGHSHGGDESLGGKNLIMEGVFLHVLADTLGSVGVIISSICMQWFGWMYADPICSMCIALMIFGSVIPLLKNSASILLQRCPFELDDKLPGLYQRLLTVDGVLNFRDAHFWLLSTDNTMGTIYLLLRPDADHIRAVAQVKHMFRQGGVRELVVQVEYAMPGTNQPMDSRGGFAPNVAPPQYAQQGHGAPSMGYGYEDHHGHDHSHGDHGHGHDHSHGAHAKHY